jgi:hypothetical protein
MSVGTEENNEKIYIYAEKIKKVLDCIFSVPNFGLYWIKSDS